MHLGQTWSLTEENLVGNGGRDTAAKGTQESSNRKSTLQAHGSSPSSLLLSLCYGNKILLSQKLECLESNSSGAGG